MTTSVDIVNRSLQLLGTRTTVSADELALGTSNEAKQASLVLASTRDQLCRMAPWGFCDALTQLVYVTSACGTPENQLPSPPTWVHGLPLLPWLYEYAYPSDCLRALEVLSSPSFSGVSIYPPTVVSLPAYPTSANRFRVASDKFYPARTATVASGGSGYTVGEVINLDPAGRGFDSNFIAGFYNTALPQGVPPQLLVTGVTTVPGVAPSGDFTDPGLANDFASDPGVPVLPGVITSVEVLRDRDFNDTDTGDDFGPDNPTDYTAFASGGYFRPQLEPVPQLSSTLAGSGATFNLAMGPRTDMRVLLCNEPQALLRYIKRVTDPSVMDDLFIEAWTHVLAAQLSLALTGDKALANLRLQTANRIITEARVADGNEGYATDERLPEWIAVRGLEAPPTTATYNWGPLWPTL